MSMFLGPIHYMMFGKIKNAADRSREIIKTFNAKYPAETAEVVKAALPDGAVDFGTSTLDEILGDNPIHHFLQSLIDSVEVAEAALVTALLYRFPDDGEKLLAKAFYEHGRKTCEKALGGKPATSPLGAFQQIMGTQYLEGMPCDQVSSFKMKGQNLLEVGHSDCLHRAKWEEAGAPTHTMCALLDQWALGCANAIDPKITLVRSAAIVNGTTECSCQVTA